MAAAKKTIAAKKKKPALGEVVIVYSKSSSHWCGLSQPEIVAIEGIKFIQGTQITGKTGHRMEGKRTLIPLDHVASLVEFASEDDLWSEPQPKHMPAPEEARQSVVLTSHEQQFTQPRGNSGQQPQHQNQQHGQFHRRHKGNRSRYPNQR
jgi:hypothetical protein